MSDAVAEGTFKRASGSRRSGGGGGGGGKKGRASAPSPAPPAAQPPPPTFLDLLGHAAWPQIMAFLRGRDQSSLRRVKSCVWRDFVSSMRGVDLPSHANCSKRDPHAFIRLLQQNTDLQYLGLRAMYLASGEAERLLVQGIGAGIVGTNLRLLKVPELGDNQVRALLGHLKAGRLVHLEGLVLPWLDDGNGLAGAAIADMVEARKQLGRPAMAHLEGIGSVQPASLRRIWDCCEPRTVEFLEARGGPQLKALGEYMKSVAERSRGAAFRSLGIMHLGGGDGGHDDAQPHTLVGMADVLEVLSQGRAPKLCELQLHDWAPAKGSIAPLGQAIGGSKLQLRELTLHRCEFQPGDFCALVDGFFAASNELLSLSLDHVRLVETELHHLINTLYKGGGWAELETLRLREVTVKDPKDPYWKMDIIPLGLAGGVPCMDTIRDLAFYGCEFDLNTFRIFVEDCLFSFPNLVRLEGDFAADKVKTQCLLDALLDRVGEYEEDETSGGSTAQDANDEASTGGDNTDATDDPGPWLLEHLSLDTDYPLYRFIREIAPVFEYDGLPELHTFNITAPRLDFFPNPSSMFDTWKELGPLIKLEHLGLQLEMSQEVAKGILEAFEDPALCPSLVSMSYPPGSMCPKDVDAMFERRRKTREGEP